MEVSQRDIAQLTDRQVKALALAFNTAAGSRADPLSGFYRSLTVSVVHAMRERRRTLLLLEAEVMTGALVSDTLGDDEGSLVSDLTPDELEQIAQARREAGHADDPP